MRRAIVFVLAALVTTPAWSQSIILAHFSEPSEATPEIIGGKKASPANWPATFIFTAVGGAACTATAIGPNALITAAHCAPTLTRGSIKGSTVVLSCEPDPFYPGQTSYDVALCYSTDTIPIGRDDPYETLNLATPPAINADVTLLGYGCTENRGAGSLYEGTSFAKSANVGDPYFWTEGGASVCGGDSGGGAYQPQGTFRRIVGVAAADHGAGKSRITALADPGIAAFIRRFANAEHPDWRDATGRTKIKVRICGLPSAPVSCRG